MLYEPFMLNMVWKSTESLEIWVWKSMEFWNEKCVEPCDWISTYAFEWHCYADEIRAGEILVMGWFLYCICMLCLDCLHLYVSLPLERYKLYCAEVLSDLDDCSDAQRVLNKE